MGNIFRNITNNRRNLLSSRAADQIHSKQLVKKFSRRHQINTILLTITIIMLGSLAIIMTRSKDSKPQHVLGTAISTKSRENLLTPTSVLSATEFCHQNGGQVISNALESGLDQNSCKFLDGTECDLSTYFQTGTCSNPNQLTSEKSVYIPEKATPTNVERQQYVYYLTIYNKSSHLEIDENS